MSKRIMVEMVSNQKYCSKDFWTLCREFGRTPNGNEIGGHWVLRNEKGEWIDFDKYRHDLAERNNIELKSKMLYDKDCVTKVLRGETVPMSQDGSVDGYGTLINGTIYHKAMLVFFSDGSYCNADSVDEAISWMNKLGPFDPYKYHIQGEQ